LNAEKLIIPDNWDPVDVSTSIKPGHTIGKPEYLFSQIKPEKEAEWRDLFGGEEQRKAKLEAAEKKAKKAAEKAKKKEKKAAGKDAESKPSVEAIEKGGDASKSAVSEKEGVDEVTEGVKQAVLQSS
jgi:methionyl-tRNA synthetase